MDLLARKEALSHQIEMMEEGIAFTDLQELCFCLIGNSQNTSLGALDLLAQKSQQETHLNCASLTSPSFSANFAQQSSGELPMNEGRNFFVWLVFMAVIFVTLAVLETLLEVPDISQINPLKILIITLPDQIRTITSQTS